MYIKILGKGWLKNLQNRKIGRGLCEPGKKESQKLAIAKKFITKNILKVKRRTKI